MTKTTNKNKAGLDTTQPASTNTFNHSKAMHAVKLKVDYWIWVKFYQLEDARRDYKQNNQKFK